MTLSRPLAALALIALLPFCVASDKPPRPKHPLPAKPAGWKPIQHESYVAYWTLEAGWNTRLEIRNNVPWHDVNVTPVLRTAAGSESPLPAVTVSPNEIKELNLRLLAVAAAPDLLDKPTSFGSVALRFNSNDAQNIFSSTIIERTGSPIAFHFDGEASADPTQMAGSVESIWWLPTSTATDYLLLSNSSRNPLNARVILTDSAGGSTQVEIGLGPAQTKRVDIRELTTRSHLQGAQGGVTISMQSGAGSLEASQFVFDDPTGFAVTMKTFETDPSDKPALHNIHAPMMALASPDRVLNFPDGTVLNPQLFLRNTSAAPLELSGIMDWRSVDASGQLVMPVLTLNPGELRVLHLSDYQKGGQIPADAHWSTVSFSYFGRPGDLVPIASSYDASGKYGLQTPFSEGMAAHWVGSMWHVDGTRDTLITATNGGIKTTHAAVVLYYDAGQHSYQLQQLLNPGQQLWVDVGQIIEAQLPDKDGNVIPPGTTMGSYALMDLDNGAGTIYEGKLVLDKAYGHGYYGCATCCAYSKPDGVIWDPSSYTSTVGNGTWNSLFAYNMCYSDWDDVTPSGSGWNSTNSAVATVASEYTNLVGAGSATGFANNMYLDWNNPRTNCGPTLFTVQDQSITAKPTIGVSQPLWFVGPGASYTFPNGVGSTQVALIANGASGGTFQWDIIAGTSIASFAGGSFSATTSSNSITLYSNERSQFQNDVTVRLTYNGVIADEHSLTVRQPYRGTSSVAPSYGVADCSAFDLGSNGWDTDVTWTLSDQFGSAISSMDMYEKFTSVTDYSSNWPSPTESYTTTNGSGVFIDKICIAAPPGALSPQPVPPPANPNTALYQIANQTWYVGYVGLFSVITDRQLLYIDHGGLDSIVSPVYP